MLHSEYSERSASWSRLAASVSAHLACTPALQSN